MIHHEMNGILWNLKHHNHLHSDSTAVIVCVGGESSLRAPPCGIETVLDTALYTSCTVHVRTYAITKVPRMRN